MSAKKLVDVLREDVVNNIITLLRDRVEYDSNKFHAKYESAAGVDESWPKGGFYGKVYKMKERNGDGKVLAVKEVTFGVDANGKKIDNILQTCFEAVIFRDLQNECIVKAYPDKNSIVLHEECDSEEFTDLIFKRPDALLTSDLDILTGEYLLIHCDL